MAILFSLNSSYCICIKKPLSGLLLSAQLHTNFITRNMYLHFMMNFQNAYQRDMWNSRPRHDNHSYRQHVREPRTGCCPRLDQIIVFRIFLQLKVYPRRYAMVFGFPLCSCTGHPMSMSDLSVFRHCGRGMKERRIKMVFRACASYVQWVSPHLTSIESMRMPDATRSAVGCEIFQWILSVVESMFASINAFGRLCTCLHEQMSPTHSVDRRNKSSRIQLMFCFLVFALCQFSQWHFRHGTSDI